jgi:hypothetical protein
VFLQDKVLPVIAASTSMLACWHDLPDDAVAEMPGPPAMPLTGPGITAVNSAPELVKVVRAAAVRGGWRPGPGHLEEELGHEEQHVAAAKAVGYQVIWYVFCEWREGGLPCWQVAVQYTAPANPVRKLEYAAIIAAPQSLSLGDLAALRAMGYASRADVLARARRAWPGLRHAGRALRRRT